MNIDQTIFLSAGAKLTVGRSDFSIEERDALLNALASSQEFRLNEPGSTPCVLVEVVGGVAEVTCSYGKVGVVLVDHDQQGSVLSEDEINSMTQVKVYEGEAEMFFHAVDKARTSLQDNFGQSANKPN